EFSDVRGRQLAWRIGRQLAPQTLADSLLRLGASRAVRAEVPSRLKRASTVRTPAALPLAALRARDEVDADSRAAARAERAHLANFGHNAQQFFRRRDAAFHFGEPVLAQSDHAARRGDVADLRFG